MAKTKSSGTSGKGISKSFICHLVVQDIANAFLFTYFKAAWALSKKSAIKERERKRTLEILARKTPAGLPNPAAAAIRGQPDKNSESGSSRVQPVSK